MSNSNKAFVFLGHDLDKKKKEATFHYMVKFPSKTEYFSEKLLFIGFSNIPEKLLNTLLNNLMLILGISYWRLYCPKNIEIVDNFLTQEQAKFWNTVYTKGLGEFFYKNKIDFRDLVQFPYHSNDMYHHSSVGNSTVRDRSLLMVGGGKDSIVSAEFLKANKKDFTAFVVNDYPIQKKIIKLLGVNSITVKRKIDKKLLKLKKLKDAYSGHVPISAIYAFIALLVAEICGYRYIISSNEASANYGNVEYLGEEINHQWSKSMEFEEMFGNYVNKYITPDIYYFSLLRPFHEIKIAQLFSKYPNYFPTFSSCNKNFTIEKQINKKWCRKCPKCAFIFAILAAFLSKDEVIKIFGKNLFADTPLANTYKELLGVKNSKPFECVGTPEETRLALYLVYKKGEFNNDIVIRMFKREVLLTLTYIDRLESNLLASTENLIPKGFRFL